MNTVNVSCTQTRSRIPLGKRGENGATQVVFDFSAWAESFGDGVVTMLVKRSMDEAAYPVYLATDGTSAVWTVTSTDTEYSGNGAAEWTYTAGETVAKSAVFLTEVRPDIGMTTEPPDRYETWLETMTDLESATLDNANTAQRSAEDAAESAQAASDSADEAASYYQTVDFQMTDGIISIGGQA